MALNWVYLPPIYPWNVHTHSQSHIFWCCRCRLAKANKQERSKKIWQKILFIENKERRTTRGEKKTFLIWLEPFLSVFITVVLVCFAHIEIMHRIELPFQSILYWFGALHFYGLQQKSSRTTLKGIVLCCVWKTLVFPCTTFSPFFPRASLSASAPGSLLYIAIKKKLFNNIGAKWNSIQQMDKLIIFSLWMSIIMMCQLTELIKDFD